MVLLDRVIHLYWAYALARAEEMFKVTRLPAGNLRRAAASASTIELNAGSQMAPGSLWARPGGTA